MLSRISTNKQSALNAKLPRLCLSRLQGDLDLPPLKWSSLKYMFRMEDKIDGVGEKYSGRDRSEAATG
ncbi:hypothetical protein [Afipia felis]|uniref:Uncharacterized protein n=2 Tax=Afipia felis TaxID=1035 RepID=A0A380W467_AFIFE|nr:hypothetical protein [Afipia felis]EKS30940.1 hypothetical protein HMPREF9697_03468 [Afipia felis ATCC 53690]SUU75684.1 Uncharacterised protein [Afipia felis]SUU83751.1 Uncharacterised protein [Afipia felis]